MGRPMHNDIHTSMLLGKFLVPQNIFQKTLRLLILYFVSQNSTLKKRLKKNMLSNTH